MTSDEIELVDLRTEVSDAAERRALCNSFFEDVYRPAFPKLDQAEGPEIWLPLLEGTPPPPEPVLHLVVARRSDGEVVGGVVVEYFRISRAALVTYVAVAPRQQGQGLARRLLEAAVAHVTADNGGTTPYIFGEVERPEAQRTPHDRGKAQARLAIIAGLGGRRLDFDYIQPSLGPGKRPADDLMLVLLARHDDESVPADDLRAFIDEFFASLRQEGGPDHERVVRSLQGGPVAVEEIESS